MNNSMGACIESLDPIKLQMRFFSTHKSYFCGKRIFIRKKNTFFYMPWLKYFHGNISFYISKSSFNRFNIVGVIMME